VHVLSSGTSQLPELIPRRWRVRREARELYRTWQAMPLPADLVHPLWTDAREEFAELIESGLPSDFLHRTIVRHMLYRTGFGELEAHELAYIEQTSAWVRSRCHAYRESQIGHPTADCDALDISVSSLNKLYYFARIAEAVPLPGTVVEFGAGYGLLCHVFCTLLSTPPTYVCVDLPELLALQYTYLVSSGIPVRAHTSVPRELDPGVAHLVPVSLISEAELRCDLFISTFALSEVPTALQDILLQRRFFGASSLYLTGQVIDADLWNKYSLEEMSSVRNAVERIYAQVRVESMPAISAWELLASEPCSACGPGT
jgi:hypothetical protein